MRVYQDFFSYDSGVYEHSEIAERYESGYHSVRIIGWGEESSLKYWVSVKLILLPFYSINFINSLLLNLPLQLAVNSWGHQWGEDGLFRIQRGTNECEIESFVLGVWAKTM